MKFRIVFSALIAILIEIFAFNFSTLTAHISGITPQIFSSDQLNYLNWENTEGQKISLPDPIIYVEGLNVKVRSAVLEIDAHPMPQTYTVFYTTQEEEAFSPDHMLTITTNPQNKEIHIQLPRNDMIYALRIDPGEEAGMHLHDVSIHLNEFKWDISPARIIAVLVVYWGTLGLMRLQKNPDYGIGQEAGDADEA